MDYVTAKVALGGDAQNVMYRGRDRPLSWPEVRVIQEIHGQDSVYDADFLYERQENAYAEKLRLLGIYGAEVVNSVYPGARPAMDMVWPGDRAEPATTKRVPKRPLPERDESRPLIVQGIEEEPAAVAEVDPYADPSVVPQAVLHASSGPLLRKR